MQTSFRELLHQQWQKKHFLCVGLDADYEKLPTAVRSDSVLESLVAFNQIIIDATAEYCCAYKPNIAFYEGYGLEGLEALIRTNQYLRLHYPQIPIILDAKRADIGNTNQGYLKAVEEVFLAQAVTLHPYLGKEALAPFLERENLGLFILCHTSNPGAAEFQERMVERNKPLYQVVAANVGHDWNSHGNCGLVVGATYPQQLAEVRKLAPELPLLIPGIGAQGGDLFQTIRNGLDKNQAGIIINASRSILYASGGDDFGAAANQEAARMERAIHGAIETVVSE